MLQLSINLQFIYNLIKKKYDNHNKSLYTAFVVNRPKSKRVMDGWMYQRTDGLIDGWTHALVELLLCDKNNNAVKSS